MQGPSDARCIYVSDAGNAMRLRGSRTPAWRARVDVAMGRMVRARPAPGD